MSFPRISDHESNKITAERLPEGLSFREWSRTKFAFGKLAGSGKTYKEVYTDTEMASYCQGCLNHLGSKISGAVAQDLELLFVCLQGR